MLDRVSAALDQENVQGRLAYTWATANRPATLDGELRRDARCRCVGRLR